MHEIIITPKDQNHLIEIYSFVSLDNNIVALCEEKVLNIRIKFFLIYCDFYQDMNDID